MKHSETAGRSVLISAIDLASLPVVRIQYIRGGGDSAPSGDMPPQSQAEKTADFLTISKPNLTYLSVFFSIRIWMGS